MFFSKRLFLLFVFLLPFQIALNPVSGIDLASGRLFLVILFLFWLFESLISRSFFISADFITFFLVFFLFFSCFSLVWAENINWALRKIIFFISIFPLYFISLNLFKRFSRKYVEKIFSSIIFSGAIAALIGIIQFLTQFVFGLETVFNFWAKKITFVFFGKSFGAAILEYPSWLVEINGKTVLRATSFFPDPHMLAFFLGLILPLVPIFSKGFIRYFYFFTYSLCVFLTFSRAGYVGLFCSLGTILFWHIFLILRKGQNVKKICFFVFLSVFFVFLFFKIENPVLERFYSSFDVNDGSVAGRLIIWREAVNVWLNNFFIGTGLGNYSLEIKPSADYREPIYAHNTYLDIAAELGFFGLFFWVFLLVTAIVKSFYKKRPELAGSLVWFSTQSFFDTAIFSVNVLPLLMIILALSSLNSDYEE